MLDKKLGNLFQQYEKYKKNSKLNFTLCERQEMKGYRFYIEDNLATIKFAVERDKPNVELLSPSLNSLLVNII